ncbi:MAG: sugar ABC transporter permease [Acidimicrobiales bacterium]
MASTAIEEPTTTDRPGAEEPAAKPRRGRGGALKFSGRDKLIFGLMIGVPTAVHVLLVWIPTLGSILLSFTDWNGIRFSDLNFVGLENYNQIVTVFEKDFFQALINNAVLMLFLFIGPTTLGMFLAYLLDKEMKGTRIYQSLFYTPVVLSLAVVGFIWKSVMYSPKQGFATEAVNALGGSGGEIDWIGNQAFFSFPGTLAVLGILFLIIAGGVHLFFRNPIATGIVAGIGLLVLVFSFTTDAQPEYGISKNFAAILVAIAWRHTGYIMVLYLAGMKSVDQSLRESAALDGCNEWQSFRHVLFPTLKPINVVVAVITVIEALRAFDIIFALNKPRKTEVLSILVTNNLLGEGGGNVGRGSAYAVILFLLCLAFVIWYVTNHFRASDL